MRRELNRDADALANVALDSGEVSSAVPSIKTGAAGRTPQPSHIENRVVAAEPRISAPPVSIPRRRIRARFVRGVLVPSEPLNLPEGTEVLADIRGATEE